MSISSKLFLGFLLVIFLNVMFVVVVARFSQMYSIARMLGWQDEAKSQLLRISALHSAQRTNFVIVDKLGRKGSYDLLLENSRAISASIDSLHRALSLILGVDTTISEDRGTWRIRREFDDLYRTATRRLPASNAAYMAGVTAFADLTLGSPVHDQARADTLRSTVRSASDSLVRVIEHCQNLVNVLTRLRLADAQVRIGEARATTALIIACMSVFALIFGYVFSRRITQSMRRLKESAGRIGKGDFEFSAVGYPQDEIGDLAHAFARMAQDLKVAQEELVRSKRMAAIGQIVASVNHEINNPLMIISGNAQLLEMSLADRPEDVQRIRSIIDEADRISLVTRRLRDMRNPIVEQYTLGGEEMINIDKSLEHRRGSSRPSP